MEQQINPESEIAHQMRQLFADMADSQKEWQDKIGFGEEGHALRSEVARRRGLGLDDPSYQSAVSNLRNYYMAKMALVMTEVAEATDEFRKHDIGERYYSTDLVESELQKPEGVLSEAADVLIRFWSLFGEAGLGAEFADAIIEKLNYNANRAHKHGGKSI